jgi:hypothetical protein
VMLLWAASSVVAKVTQLKETGERAREQIASLFSAIPAEAHDIRVGLVFIESELPPRRTYSVFRGGDDHLIQPGQPAQSMVEWFRPGRNIELEHANVSSESEAARRRFDMVLRWDPQARRFRRLTAS